MPAGITGLRDLPYTVFDAIHRATMFLGLEEMDDDERPPREIWHRGDKLRAWMDDVRARRARTATGADRDIEDPVDNDAAKGLVVG